MYPWWGYSDGRYFVAIQSAEDIALEKNLACLEKALQTPYNHMRESREIIGLWWLPAKPDERWTGKLKIRPKKSPKLRIILPENRYSRIPAIPEVLHGCDQHGKPVTLLHAVRDELTMSGAIARVKCSSGYALIGIHVSAPSEFGASTLSVRAQYLYDWLGQSGFKREETLQYESIVHHVLPAVLSFEMNPEMSLKVISTSSTVLGHKRASVSEGSAIKFESKAALPISRCHELVNAIRSLLHFATLREVYPVALNCRVFEGKPSQEGGERDSIDVELVSSSNHEEPIGPFRDWVFQFSDVQSDFGLFFQNWLTILSRFEEAVGCYFSTVYNALPDSVEHLCLTQALESFHSIKHQSHQNRDFVEKMQDLIEQQKPELASLFPVPKEAAKVIRDNRNYYTHHNPKWLKGGRVVRRGELVRLNAKLRILIQACMLAELGIPRSRFRILVKQLDFNIVEYA